MTQIDPPEVLKHRVNSQRGSDDDDGPKWEPLAPGEHLRKGVENPESPLEKERRMAAAIKKSI
jgi:hypothetical protein